MRFRAGRMVILSLMGMAAGLPRLLASSPAPSWQEEALARLRSSEYHFSARPEGDWSAPNRAHGLRAGHDGGALEITSRTGGPASWGLSMRLASWGRPGSLRRAGPGQASPAGRLERLEVVRDGLTEWYINDEKGLEQGFTIERPPEGASREGPLVLELALEGTLRARLSEDRRSATFLDRRGQPALLYRDLAVVDSHSRELTARLEASAAALRIVIEDDQAIYPITIDPLMTSPGWTAEGTVISDLLGLSVSTAGDVNGDGYSDVIVGVPNFDSGLPNEGRALVFLGSPSGPSLTASWWADGQEISAWLGQAVSTAGDVNNDGFDDIIVGAPNASNGESLEGRAYAWLGSASGLGPAGTPSNADWVAESNQASAAFGSAVATAGDVNGDGRDEVLVGAPQWDGGEADEGRVYLFLGVPSGIAVLAVWAAQSNQTNLTGGSQPAKLGSSVGGVGDLDGDGFDDIIAGAPFYDNGSLDEGSVFLWLGDSSFGSGADGTPANADWIAESNVAGTQMGHSVARAGDVNADGYADLIVGCPLCSSGQAAEGEAFVWHGSSLGPGPSGIPMNADWTAQSNQSLAHLGTSVATAGDVDGNGYADVIVGAAAYSNGEVQEGAVFVWRGGVGGLGPPGTPLNADWQAEEDGSTSNLGSSAGTAGDVNGDGFSDVIAGAPGFESPGTDEGRAFVYLGGPEGPATTSVLGFEGDAAGARLGVWAAAGDFNGDGFGDIVAGAPLFDNGEVDEGRVVVYSGSRTGTLGTITWSAESDQAGAQMGASVAAGDLNGDGFADLVAGAPQYDSSPSSQGALFAWLGGASDAGNPSGLGDDGTPANADWTAAGESASASLGQSVAWAGDVNGDGLGDLIAGAPFFSNGQTSEGRAYLYLGAAAPPFPASWSDESDDPGARFGWSVAGAGDVNEDGFSDVIVGAPRFTNVQTDEGAAFLYLGSGSGLSAQPAWSAESNQASANFGVSVAGAGDVNGDGSSDLIVGAGLYNGIGAGEGWAFLWLGSPSGMGAAGTPSNPDWTAQGGLASLGFGASVAGAGDLNADGYGDVVIGAPEYDNGSANEGGAFVWLGSATGLGTPGVPGNADWRFESDQLNAQAGSWVGPAGDRNADGFDDFLVGSHLHDGGLADEGRVVIYPGNASGGVGLMPRQARSDDSALVPLLGQSDSSAAFRIRLRGRTPAGRGQIKLQWETEPLGSPFDGIGLEASSAWNDTGAPAGPAGSFIDLSQSVTGLAGSAFLRWRARIVSDSPFFPRSPWLRMPGNGFSETDLRTFGCLDQDGDGYGAPAEPDCAEPALDCDDSSDEAFPGHPEACDNLDNDCNGTVDSFATTCGAGVCAAAGSCVAGRNSCRPGAPSAELCDNLDNDCDGTVDSFATTCGVGACQRAGTCASGGDSCVAGSPSAEVCDGLDDDCDGSLPVSESDLDADQVMVCENDCDDSDPGLYHPPEEVAGVDAFEIGPSMQVLRWVPQSDTAGPATVYDLFGGATWSADPGDFSEGRCVIDDGPALVDISAVPVPPGEILYFLVRAQNGCPGGTGTYGTANRDDTAASSPAPCD